MRRPSRSIAARVSAGSRRSMWTMSQPASASAIAAVLPMPRVVPVTHATRPSRRKLSRTPGTGRGYHRARGPADARARDLARARARRRRPDRRRLAGTRCSCCPTTRRPPTRFPLADIERDALPRPAPGCPSRAPRLPAARRRHVERHPRGGRAGARASAQPLSPRRRDRELAPRARRARRRDARRVDPAAGALRDDEPTRFYLAQADVRRDLLEPSETVRSRRTSAAPSGSPPASRRAAPRRRLDVPLPDPPDAAHRGPARVPGRARREL